MIKHAKATATFTHCVWREGRPRFSPGNAMRKLGYASHDLKHPNGMWFTFDETKAFSKSITAEANARRTDPAQAANLPAISRRHESQTLGQLCEAVFDLPAFQNKPIMDGKLLRQPLARKTVETYRYCRRMVEAACNRLAEARKAKNNLWHCPAALLNTALLQSIINEVERHSGLSTARATRAFLRQMWSRIGKREPGVERHLFDDLEKMPTPGGRVHAWEPAEFWHMLATADGMNLPAMGDSFVWGVLTGLRRIDRLIMRRTAINETHITITPNKTKNSTATTVQVKYDGLLRDRQEAAWARRKDWPVQWPHVLCDEANRKYWQEEGSHYWSNFDAVRRKAAATMPSCAALRDQDLRDTFQTWLDRANVDPELMSLAAGHSTTRKLTALQRKHYVATNQPRLDAAFNLVHAYVMKARPVEMMESEG